jgi:hypothetical protein
LLLLVSLPLLVHLPALLGFVHADAALLVSGLAPAPPLTALGQPFIDGNAGGTTQALGGLAARDWLHGHLPWWNPYAGVGMPLAAEMQPMAFFLPFVLLLSFANGLMYLKIVLQIIAGLATYAALREHGLSRTASCLGGVMFELNGTFAWFGDTPIAPIAFLPLLIWGIERSAKIPRNRQIGGMAIIAAAIAWSLVAGFPQTAFIDGVLAGLWALGVLMRLDPFRDPARAANFCVRLGVAAVIGLLLAMPAVLPFKAYVLTGSMGAHVYAEQGVLALDQLPVLGLPYVFGPILADGSFDAWSGTGGFVDLACLCLALMALTIPRPGVPGAWLSRAEFAGRALLGLWLVFALLAVGGERQADWIRHALPLLRHATFRRYAMPSISFAAAALAAAAINDWLRGAEPVRARCRRMMWAALSLSTVAVACLIGAGDRLHADWRGQHWWTIASVALAALTLTAITWSFAQPLNRRSRSILAGVICTQACLFFLPPVLAMSRSARMDLAPVDYLRAHLGLGRVYAMDDILRPNYGSLYGVAAINYFSVPVAANWSDYMQQNLDPYAHADWLAATFEADDTGRTTLQINHQAFEQMGVTHVLVGAASDPLTHADPYLFRRVYSDKTAHIYRLTQAAPYVEARGAACTLTPLGREHVLADCPAPAQLVRRELMFDSWRARVNGRHARMQVTDDIFQRIDLPAGHSDVVFRYVPPQANRIAILFGAGLVGFVGLLTWWWRREGKPSFFAKKDQKTFFTGAA